jgi:pimeloyl-ACP methyl ester carboxylesterase
MFDWYNNFFTANPMFGFARFATKNAMSMFMDAQRAQAGLHQKEIQLDDGLTYVYLEGGKGEPLFLLHCFGADKDILVSVARHLTTRYRLIIPDQLGFGESSQPEEADYSPQAQAERLRRFADALGITRLHLGGSSMGGHIALSYAALFPEEVKSLWLLDPTGVWSAPKSTMQKALESTGRNPLFIEKEEDFPGLLQLLMCNPPTYLPHAIISVLAEPHLKNSHLAERILMEIGTDSVEERVTGLDMPTLIVWGGEDQIAHVKGSKILNDLMPRSRVIVMPNTGHLPILENPQECAGDYLEFRDSMDE